MNYFKKPHNSHDKLILLFEGYYNYYHCICVLKLFNSFFSGIYCYKFTVPKLAIVYKFVYSLQYNNRCDCFKTKDFIELAVGRECKINLLCTD